jgi:DNA-binding transcriptional regulator YiaG
MLSVYGRNGEYECQSNTPETPGTYCFPPLGSLITAAARLMLALLERCVTDAGGSYVFADTDSMAIVSSKSGGLVECEGGSYQLEDGRSAVQALPWKAVKAIVKRFNALNPYDSKYVPGSILKIEDVNYQSGKGKQIQIYTYAISAKRYALYALNSEGCPEMLKNDCSKHGIGQFLNPLDPDWEDQNWIGSVWQGIVEEQYGGIRFEPDWVHQPAVMRTMVSSPVIGKWFDRINQKKSYAKQVKPFNFLLSVSVNAFERPPKASEQGGFHLIAPYSSKPAEWLRFFWMDLYTNDRYRIRSKDHSDRAAIRVQTFDDILERFRNHPEAKSADSEGNPSDEKTIGLLGRLHVHVLSILHIGKESNQIEQQEEGVLLSDPQVVYSEEGDWEMIRSQLGRVSISRLARLSGVSERRLREYRQGDRKPSPKRLEAIAAALGRVLGNS